MWGRLLGEYSLISTNKHGKSLFQQTYCPFLCQGVMLPQKCYSVCSLVVPRLEEAILTPVLKKNFKRPLILGQEGHNYPPKHSNLSYDQFGVRLEQSDTAPPFSLLAGEILILSAGFVLFSTVVFLGDLEIYFFVPVSGH